jgi:hypothetical protein
MQKPINQLFVKNIITLKILILENKLFINKNSTTIIFIVKMGEKKLFDTQV